MAHFETSVVYLSPSMMALSLLFTLLSRSPGLIAVPGVKAWYLKFLRAITSSQLDLLFLRVVADHYHSDFSGSMLTLQMAFA